jgi:hypothetical protein
MIETRILRLPHLWVGVFVLLFAGVLVVLGLMVPVRGDFTAPPAPSARSPAPGLSCLLVSFRARELSGPVGIRLAEAQVDPSEPWHRAFWMDFSPGSRRPARVEQGEWRRAGSDSIDVQPYAHGLAIRLPTNGDTLVGRSGWTYYPNFWAALTWPRSVVVALRVNCDSLVARAAV